MFLQIWAEPLAVLWNKRIINFFIVYWIKYCGKILTDLYSSETLNTHKMYFFPIFHQNVPKL